MPRRILSSARAALRHHLTPVVVLVLGLLATVAAWQLTRTAIGAQSTNRFMDEAERTTTALTERMSAYEAMLRAGRGFVIAVGGDPSALAFRDFVASLELGRRYPGIQGIGWSKLVLPDELEAHEGEQRAAGRPDYRIWPPGARELYSSIVLLEPLDWRNQRAIGYDMFSEPIRRAAMARARDTGEPSATRRVELVQEAGAERQAGFLVYVPVYSGAPRTLEERREQLRGWIYAPFRAGDLLRGAVGETTAKEVGLSVYDGGELGPAAILFDARAPGERTALTLVRRVEIAGRPWTLHYQAGPRFATATERFLPLGVAVAGLALTLLLFWVTRDEVKARSRAELSARRAAFLAEAGKVLSSSLDYSTTVAAVADLAAERAAETCIVYLEEPEGPRWSVGHRDPRLAARLGSALDGAGFERDAEIGPGATLAGGHPRARNGFDPERIALAARAPALAAALREAGVGSSLTVALSSRGERLGAITLLGASSRRFGRGDVRLATDLARLVGAAVDTSRLYAAAQNAIRERDEFLSIASHELRTPLTSLALQSESLRARATRLGVEDVARKAEVIRRNVDRLARLVASLLDLSRITAGRLELEIESFDLAELARDVVGRFEDEARRAGCELVLSAPEPVPGSWDRLRLDQVLTNLVSNAIKYGPNQPVEVRVEGHGERAIASVRDRGIGISPEDQARIFGRFERAVSKRSYGGFGLGLWIVREIVESLGGTVRVESAPGEGATFTVELPRRVHAAAPQEPGLTPAAPA
ncbi:CHASE domain-containing protein [Anaeromyxobacter sp. Fw109-5]|uniref:CHASE domain-containing sensor histidine kinase n=1 Tax=Anaeromyxobacter sp. (strain Fw109-5) TaxID=404589 RepID=UPI0000ED76C7|nr:CHASE domain-containing protein [Anaeromyxobacter sp. Fw109-5]ABS25926.1 GAF sensor signal transduction histidine kinase [Anaeromyxobacter sp. Fw109-5]